MKKTIALMLTILMLSAALAACDQNGTPTDAETSGTLGEVTETLAETEQTTEQHTTEPTATEPPTTEPEESTLNELGLPFEIVDLPVGYAGDKMLRGYNASGCMFYDEELNCLWADGDDNLMVVTNDTMESGSLSATFLSAPGYINDNGIIFGMEESAEGEYEFWEYGPAYYFLFISDACHLYLAKAGYNGQAWTELEITEQPVTDYTHGETVITITVEFDGEGSIKCYANGELLIDYQDSDPIRGNRYGVRCEVFGVEYYNIQAIHD